MSFARRAARRVTTLALLAAGVSAWADDATSAASTRLRLNPLLGDHAVLQRDQPIPVAGHAAPGSTVRVLWHGRSHLALADAQGRWALHLPAEHAGGPYELTVQAERSLTVRDLMVGEVWVCSGQSNMEWSLADALDGARTVAAADEPLIRAFKVPHTLAFTPRDEVDGAAAWQVATPVSAGAFSAIGYHFAHRLQPELGVAVGLLDASWGGTGIETWTRREAYAAVPEFAPWVAQLAADAATLTGATRARMTAAVSRWQGTLPAAATPPAGWTTLAFDDHDWPVLQAPGNWEGQGLPDVDGVVLHRRVVTLTAEQAAAPATLHLGAIDDADDTTVNGQHVGGLTQWNAPRDYPLPAGLLQPGPNLIAVAVTDTGGGGGFHGDPAAMRLTLGAQSLSLAGPWKARVQSLFLHDTPQPDDRIALLYNGMLHPITRVPVRGVLWYQGENNAGRAALYARELPLMMADWRAQWHQPRLPFFIVQLAAFQPLANNVLDGGGWAELREAQRQAAQLPGAGLVVTTDVGDADDIHPRNKRVVGERLAALALAQVHGRQVVHSGPVLRRQRVAGDHLELQFDDHGGGLAARAGGTMLHGFALAGTDGRYHLAEARLERGRVIVASAAVPAPRSVRYGWVDNPSEADLVNGAGWPASPFRTDALPLRTP